MELLQEFYASYSVTCNAYWQFKISMYDLHMSHVYIRTAITQVNHHLYLIQCISYVLVFIAIILTDPSDVVGSLLLCILRGSNSVHIRH